MKKKTVILFIVFHALLQGVLYAGQEKGSSSKKTEETTFVVSLHCAACKTKIENNIPFEKGVKDVNVDLDLDKKEVTVIYNPNKTTVEKLKKAIEDLGYRCDVKQDKNKQPDEK
ncbi:MAG: heavy metal-associated domain-containing protein [Paludibacteraceae bacterium]|nr:heavy metal-associated domain-containing protein [Paludibacteraceae bacterium]